MPGLSGGVIDATDVDATDVDDVDATQSVQSTIDDFEMVLGYCPEIKMPDSNLDPWHVLLLLARTTRFEREARRTLLCVHVKCTFHT